jgi:hypothetical protein
VAFSAKFPGFFRLFPTPGFPAQTPGIPRNFPAFSGFPAAAAGFPRISRRRRRRRAAAPPGAARGKKTIPSSLIYLAEKISISYRSNIHFLIFLKHPVEVL